MAEMRMRGLSRSARNAALATPLGLLLPARELLLLLLLGRGGSPP